MPRKVYEHVNAPDVIDFSDMTIWKLPDAIVNRRMAVNMTQDQLAAACGMTRSTIAMMETGKANNPTLAALLKVFGALGYTVELNITKKPAIAGQTEQAE